MYKYLIVNHIPRCGGSSLKKSFYEALKTNTYFNKHPVYISEYTHNNICLYDEPQLVKAIHPKTLLFIDHSPYKYIEDIFKLEYESVYRILTLRNPVDRIVSHINYFYNTHINNIQKHVLISYLDRFGDCTIQCLTNHTNISESIKKKYIVSKKYINEYSFIFKLENQKLFEVFNDDNPFELRLPNFHINRSSIDIGIKVKQSIKNLIYKHIPFEIKLLENYYEMDL